MLQTPNIIQVTLATKTIQVIQAILIIRHILYIPPTVPIIRHILQVITRVITIQGSIPTMAITTIISGMVTIRDLPIHHMDGEEEEDTDNFI